MKLIIKELRTYLENEGLSKFLPKATRRINPSIPWLAAHVILAFILTLPTGTVAIGTVVPMLTLIFFIMVNKLYTYIKLKRGGKDLAKLNFKPLEEILLFTIFALINGIFIGLLTKSLKTASFFIFGSFFITFIANWVFRSSHILFDLFQQTVKGLVSSWLVVLKTIPILVITIFLSLFSEDVWVLTNALTWKSLIIISIALIIVILFTATKINKGWIRNQILSYLDLPEKIVTRVFEFPSIIKLKQSGFVSIEDEENVLDFLKWREIKDIVKKELPKLSAQIERRHSLSILSSTLLLGFILFIILTMLFYALSPALVKIGWIQTFSVVNTQGLFSILKLSFLISTLQMAAFLSSLAEQTRENLITTASLEKTIDWISAITVFQSVLFPNSQLWSIRTEIQGSFKKWNATIGRVIVKEGLTNTAIEQICKDIEATYITHTDKVEFKIYKNKLDLIKELESDKDNFNWHYIHNLSSNHISFGEISENIDFSAEEHLLGRDYIQQDKAIPDSWFGNTPTTAIIGRAIWDLDNDHHYIMHPSVWQIKDKDILNIQIRLYKKFPDLEDYGEWVRNSLIIAKTNLENLKVINIFFCYRFEEKWVCDFQLTEDGNILFIQNGKTQKII